MRQVLEFFLKNNVARIEEFLCFYNVQLHDSFVYGFLLFPRLSKDLSGLISTDIVYLFFAIKQCTLKRKTMFVPTTEYCPLENKK